jgi:hypothetical protein
MKSGCLLRRGRAPRALEIAVAACFGVLGCASGSSNDENGVHPAPAGNLLHALCDTVQGCCMATNRTFDSTLCLKKVEQAFTVPLSDTTLSYDAAKADQCLEAITRAAEACEFIDVTLCFASFRGALPVGAQCVQSFECASGPDGFAICGDDGRCSQPKRGADGAPCAYTCVKDVFGDLQCHAVDGGSPNGAACHVEDGLVCVATATAATCQPLSADCTQDPAASCPAGQACNFSSHQCYTPAKVGADCSATPCEAGAYCEGGVCASQKANGATCTMDAECLSAKCETGVCAVYSAAARDWCGNVAL